MKDMKWIEAITAVLAKAGTSMSFTDITDEVFAKGYRTKRTKHSYQVVYSRLYEETSLFKNLGSGDRKSVV